MDIPQGLIDRLTRMDEQIAGPVMDRLESIDRGVANLVLATQQEGGSNIGTGPREKRTVDLSAQVAAQGSTPNDDQIPNDGTRTGKAPFDGWVSGFVAGWPDGAEQNAGIGLYHDERGTKYFPSGDDDFAAFNNFSHEFAVSFPVEKGEVLEVKYLNTNSTAMPLNAMVEFERAFPGEEINFEGR